MSGLCRDAYGKEGGHPGLYHYGLLDPKIPY